MQLALPWVWKRTLKCLWQTRSLTTAIFIHGMNKGWVRLARMTMAREAARFADLPTDSPRVRKLLQAARWRCGSDGAATAAEPKT